MSGSTIPGSEKIAPQKGKDNLWTRRSFLGFAAWAGFGAALTGFLLAFLRFLYPRVLFEPSPVFKAGRPEDYIIGEVSAARVTERGTRADDKASEAAMEDRKKAGYF